MGDDEYYEVSETWKVQQRDSSSITADNLCISSYWCLQFIPALPSIVLRYDLSNRTQTGVYSINFPLTVTAVPLRGRLRVLRVVIGPGPGGRVRRRGRSRRSSPSLVRAGPSASAGCSVARVRGLSGRCAPALVAGIV